MRLLTAYEVALINALLMTNSKPAQIVLPPLNTVLVEEMDDGGMGSLRFMSSISDVDRHLGKTVAEAEFQDEDGVLVSIELNLDNNNQLFELDVWKVDYSPISRWPDLERIAIKGTQNS